MKTMTFLISYLFITCSIYSQDNTSNNNPVELGKVNWLRDYDEAVLRSQSEDKPIFILFQEVPGCHTCTSYGVNVMSHPLIVKAIETYFVPLAIFNNHKGADAKILAKFNEPAWNNPVARVINSEGIDIIPRLGRAYSVEKVADGIVSALTKKCVEVPKDLQELKR